MCNIKIGYNVFNKKPVIIDFTKIVNPHILIFGSSGTGKTHTIKKLVNAIEMNNIKTNVIDGQGDITLSNSSTVVFHATSNYGINPLKFSPNREMGGIRKKIRSIISAVNKTSRTLGNRQEAVLRNLLTDLYKSFGFFEDNPATWTLEKNGRWRTRYPTVTDLIKFIEKRIYKKYFGVDKESIKQFEELKKLNAKLYRLIIKKIKNKDDEYETEKIKTQIKLLKEEMVKTYKKALDKAEGDELKDIIKYDNVEVLKSVKDIVENLFSTGIFKDKEPEFDLNSKIWRYDIKALNIDEQVLFSHFLAEEIYYKLREQGLIERVREYVVLDEAKKHLNSDDENIFNVIATEGRKYGGGLLVASQSIEHISKDIIANSAIKIITGVDFSDAKTVSSKFAIDMKYLTNIIPHKTILVSIKEKGKANNRFIPVVADIK